MVLTILALSGFKWIYRTNSRKYGSSSQTIDLNQCCPVKELHGDFYGAV
jgi:hypothetical protein